MSMTAHAATTAPKAATRAAAAMLAGLAITLNATTAATPARAAAIVQDDTKQDQDLSADRKKAAEFEQDPEIRDEKFDLGRRNLAIKGYDPVAYFPEHGGEAVKGDRDITHTHKGVTYRFSSTSNLETFKANPAKYEPAYGGWCAYAMAKGDYTEINPKRFLIQDGRLLLFYDGLFGDTYKDWHEEGPKLLEPKADAFWASELEAEAEKS